MVEGGVGMFSHSWRGGGGTGHEDHNGEGAEELDMTLEQVLEENAQLKEELGHKGREFSAALD